MDHGYVHKKEDFKLHEGVVDGLKLLKQFKLFIITNQSGIGRGIFNEKNMIRFNEHMLKVLKKNGIRIERIYFCPHAPEENCDCRKPNIKNIKKAGKEFSINIKDSWVIGDHTSDIEMAKNAGCKSVYVLTGHGAKHLMEARKLLPEYIATDLKQAAEYIMLNKSKKAIARKNLDVLVKKLRKEGKRIVTLNGTFDILHKGHEYIISEAKKQGDILIVAVNSDSSVRLNKGPERPINNENNRAEMIARYNYVDYVTVFSERTPIELLEIIRPDVHVNGSEYGDNCIEAPIVRKYDGRVHIVKLVNGYSTTKMINRNSKENHVNPFCRNSATV